MVLEGPLRVFWGVQGVIHLKEDDDQRTFIVRKRNSCRTSKAQDVSSYTLHALHFYLLIIIWKQESCSDKENEGSDSVAPPTTTASEVDPLSTDISLSESMTFDSCSLNEISELPTTPEDASANTTAGSGQVVNGQSGSSNDDGDVTNTDSSSTLIGSATDPITASTSCVSSTLPSKLDHLEKLDWDDIDDLLQVERRQSEKDKVYETMPVKLPSSSSQSSSESSPSKTCSSSTSSTTTQNNQINTASSPTTTTNTTTSSSSDNFMTATGSLTTNTNTQNTTTVSTSNTTLEDYKTSDDATLKPMDYEDFKRSVHQDYVNGANSFQEPKDGTLKRNQPIDPSRIHDSLKLYGENSVMSKSFNCEHALRSIDPTFINDTMHLRSSVDSPRSSQRQYALQKSGSAFASIAPSREHHKPYEQGRQLFEKGINRSKSGPSCFVYSDSDDDDDTTLRPHRLATVRRSDVPQRYIQIQMNCYPKDGAIEHESSRADASSVIYFI